MTCRQGYARRPPPRHRPPPGPPLPRTPAPPGSAHRISQAPTRKLPQQPSQPRAAAPTAALGSGNPARSRGRATGRTLAAWPRKSATPPVPGCPGPPREAAAPAPTPGAAGAWHRRPARCSAISSGLLPQVAGVGAVPVGVLWAALCGAPLTPLVMVGPAATAAPPDQRQPTRHNPQHHQGDRNVPGPALRQSPRPRPPA
jgi:hypothetical protein